MKSLNLILILLSLNIYSTIIGQKENNNWFFGYNNGLTFSTNPYTSISSSVYMFEGCASISDENGNLLFYSDGKNVYNKNNNLMTNGNNTLLGHSSSTSSAIIVPKPSSKVLFYIITVDYIYGTNGINYSVVNMDDNGDGVVQPNEVGEVELSSLNTNLPGPTGEKISIVKKANGNDYWIATISAGTNNFYIYEITSAGINNSPQIQSLGPSVISSNTNGYMKFSPDGTKLVRADFIPNTKVTLYDFNNATGILSNPIILTSGLTNLGWGDGFYGVEFSPNSQKVFFSTVSTNNNFGNSHIYEATISPSYTGSVLAAVVPNNGIGYAIGALQLTPETPQRILIAKDGEQYLAEIINPNAGILSNASNFNAFAIALTNNSGLGLPTFISGTYVKNDFSTIEENEMNISEKIISIYPNPTSSYITIEVKKDVKNQLITINTINGQKVKEIILNGNKIEIDLTNFEKGIYFLKLADTMKKFIID